MPIEEGDWKNDLKALIIKICGLEGFIPVKTFDATIVSVDEKLRTCLVNSEDKNIDNLTVRLSPSICDGVLNIPSVGETVLVMSGGVEPYIVSHGWLDKRIIIVGKQGHSNDGDKQVFNDGGYGGLVKVEPLADRLSKVEKLLNDLINKFNLHTHPYIDSGSPSTSSPTLTTETQTITAITTRDDIENKSITHGEHL